MAFDDRERELLDRIANALQPAALVTTRLRRELTTAAEDAVTLETSITSAVVALRELQPERRGGEQ
jgi:hypothetical protein